MQLGYLDLSDITRHRRIKLSGPVLPLGVRPRTPPNLPGFRRIQKQLRRLAPENPRKDPYIAALLIALAQEQRLYDKSGDDDDNENAYSAASAAPSQMLLVTRSGYTKWLYIYTSQVSPEFLDRLNWPSRSPPADAQSRLGMAIYYRKLAFEPYKTLPQRLAAVVQSEGRSRKI